MEIPFVESDISEGDNDRYIKNVTPFCVDVFRKECAALTQLQSQFLVQIHGYRLKLPQVDLVMEFVEGGDLLSRLQNQPIPFTWTQKREIAVQITSGLRVLHAHKLLHEDLKCSNVLLDEHGNAKLSNYGLPSLKRKKEEKKEETSFRGTPSHMAPELFRQEPSFSFSSDIYSLGMTFWEIGTNGKTPFKEETERALISQKVRAGERPSLYYFDQCSWWADLIQRCWHQDLDQRPGVECVLGLVGVGGMAKRKRGDEEMRK